MLYLSKNLGFSLRKEVEEFSRKITRFFLRKNNNKRGDLIMKRSLILFVGLIIILSLVLSISGCSSGTTTTTASGPPTYTTNWKTTTATTTTSAPPASTTKTSTPPASTTTTSAAQTTTTTPAQTTTTPTGPSVYVSVSVDGQLLFAAQPITYTEGMTADDVLKAAHTAYYSGGESGYVAGIDKTYNMYLITQCWGVKQTPYIVLNGAPIGADAKVGYTVDTVKVVANDNIIICTGANTQQVKPVSLTATRSGDSVTLTATLWVLNFSTFSYSHAPLKNANVIDPTTGASLGTTDDNGQITITIPASGIVAIENMAAINVTASATAG
jgi:hypothetical protein